MRDDLNWRTSGFTAAGWAAFVLGVKNGEFD